MAHVRDLPDLRPCRERRRSDRAAQTPGARRRRVGRRGERTHAHGAHHLAQQSDRHRVGPRRAAPRARIGVAAHTGRARRGVPRVHDPRRSTRFHRPARRVPELRRAAHLLEGVRAGGPARRVRLRRPRRRRLPDQDVGAVHGEWARAGGRAGVARGDRRAPRPSRRRARRARPGRARVAGGGLLGARPSGELRLAAGRGRGRSAHRRLGETRRGQSSLPRRRCSRHHRHA